MYEMMPGQRMAVPGCRNAFGMTDLTGAGYPAFRNGNRRRSTIERQAHSTGAMR